MSDLHDKFTGLPVGGYLPHTDDADVFVNRRKRMKEEILRRLDALKLEPGIDQRLLAIGRTAIESAFPPPDIPA